MTKADIVREIATQTGLEKQVVLQVVEGFMDSVKSSMINGEEVYLRGFGSFIIKHRAEKTARNISRNTTVIVPAHNIPAFKPAKAFAGRMKSDKLGDYMQQERYSDDPVTLYRATRLALSDWNRKRPLLKRHSWMVLSLGSDSNKAPALFSSIRSISMPCTVAAVASAGIFKSSSIRFMSFIISPYLA